MIIQLKVDEDTEFLLERASKIIGEDIDYTIDNDSKLLDPEELLNIISGLVYQYHELEDRHDNILNTIRIVNAKSRQDND